MRLRNEPFITKAVSPVAIRKTQDDGTLVHMVLLGPFTAEEMGRVQRFASDGSLTLYEGRYMHLLCKGHD
jgi:hypothetical protein